MDKLDDLKLFMAMAVVLFIIVYIMSVIPPILSLMILIGLVVSSK